MLLPIIISAVVLAAVALWAFLRFHPQFGGRFTSEHQEQFASSPQWNGSIFENPLPTSVDVSLGKIPGLIRANLKDASKKVPNRPIPIPPLNPERWKRSNAAFQFIWYGHSVCLMRLGQQQFLIDPMLGPDASPIGPVRTKRFSEHTLDIIDQLPELDAVFLTHDHYDHLDYSSIKKLKGKVPHFYTALGVKRHLVRWGVEPESITELDWWDEGQLGDLNFTFTPSRHFSGRGLTDRTKSLWGGWVFQVDNYKVYWSGDGGYNPDFREIGRRFGPFDWAFLECGQYYKLWKPIHASPEEAVQAAIDVGAKMSTPVHWGGFKLAPHDWRDPVDRFVEAGTDKGLNMAIPQPGELVTSESEVIVTRWWDDF